MSSETFEQVLAAAQADGSFTAAWKKFVKTQFYVPVNRASDDNPRNFTLHLSASPDGAHRTLLISEVRARVEQEHRGGLAALSGAEVVRLLHAEAGILVALSDRAFAIARDRVSWLKKGLEAAQAKAHAAPAVTVAPAVAPAPTPTPTLTSVPRRAPGPLDVAALEPRLVTLPRLGLEFYVPGAWTETRTSTGVRLLDQASGTQLEATGFHREDLSLAQFVAMRLDLMRQQMRYLKQDGESYPIDGDMWRDRVKGKATEFVGTFPGDEGPSRYLLACVRIEGTLVSITIRAGADAFTDHRAVYKWLLGRVDIGAVAADEAVGATGLLARRWQIAAGVTLCAVLAGGYWFMQQRAVNAEAKLAQAPLHVKDLNTARFAVPDGSFSVELPGQPQQVVIPKVVRDSMGKVVMHQFKLARSGRVYMVQAIDYGKKPADIKAALDGMQASVTGRDGVLVSSTPITVAGGAGREVRAELPGGMLRAARFALVGSKVCMVMIAVQDKPSTLPYIDDVLQSFVVNES